MRQKNSNKSFLVIFSVICLPIGLVTIFLGLYARSAFNPEKVYWDSDEFLITSSENGEIVTYYITHQQEDTSRISLHGTTDLLCDPPYLMLIDVNEDDIKDLYFYHCGGHGFVTYQQESGMPYYKNLGQFDPEEVPSVQSFWGREIRAGGFRMISWGSGVTLIGILGLIASLLINKLT